MVDLLPFFQNATREGREGTVVSLPPVGDDEPTERASANVVPVGGLYSFFDAAKSGVRATELGAVDPMASCE